MDRVENRRIVSGALGCPVCGAEYPIEDGVVCFAATEAATSSAPDPDVAMRIAAGLGLVAANVVAILDGTWGCHAPLVRALAPAQVILLNPPRGVESADGISVVRAARVPFAAGSVDGVAVDATHELAWRQSLIRVVKAGGRAFSDVSLSADGDVSEVFASEGVWIGEVQHAGPTVSLQRAGAIKRL